MKKVIYFVLAVCLAASLVGCGSEVSDNPNVGTWTGVLVEAFGIEGGIGEVYADGASLELKANGNCTAIFDGDKATGKWTGLGGRLTVSIGGVDYKCVIDGDALIFELMDGMNIIYTKSGRLPVNRAVNNEDMNIDDDEVPKNGSLFSDITDGLGSAKDEPGTGDKPMPQTISEDEARALVMAWLDGHPFGTGTWLDPDCSEAVINGEELYKIELGVERLAVFDILVEKTSGRIYVGGGNLGDSIEPIDEWYYREHSGNDGLARGYEAEIIGNWFVANGYEWHDWFVGNEAIEFLADGMGTESYDGTFWNFAWWIDVGLEMNYNADVSFEQHTISLHMIYEHMELVFFLYDNNGSILWDSKLNLDQGAGPPLVLEKW